MTNEEAKAFGVMCQGDECFEIAQHTIPASESDDRVQRQEWRLCNECRDKEVVIRRRLLRDLRREDLDKRRREDFGEFMKTASSIASEEGFEISVVVEALAALELSNVLRVIAARVEGC